MHYFRYRALSEVSLKELMYSEMYFSSPEECNDPFDSKTFYVFNSDKEKWTKVIQLASKQFKIPIAEQLINELASHICSQCPLSFTEALSRDLFVGFPASSVNDRGTINFVAGGIQKILELYHPDTRYFVSFSKTNLEQLMWSHYADRHGGFCLIFKAIDGYLQVSELYKKEQVTWKTPSSFSFQMSYGMPNKFKFIDIDYKPEVEEVNAFLSMPGYVSGDVKNEQERERIIIERESHYQQKSKEWSYEKESRLILAPPMSWLFGDHFGYTKQQRLFHYEPSQLVGIIYGARLSEDNRERIREILKERRNWGHRTVDYKRIEFSFIEFQAKLSHSQRTVEVEPLAILSYQRIPTTNANFDRLYKEWKEGIGFEKEHTTSRRIKVI